MENFLKTAMDMVYDPSLSPDTKAQVSALLAIVQMLSEPSAKLDNIESKLKTIASK